MKKNLLTAVIACLMIFSKTVFAQTLPPDFSATNIGSGWVLPAGAVFSSDGQKLFIWEKRGRVYVCNRDGSGNYIKQTTPVLNISEEVGDWRDHGLLGFALDPEYANNGLIYLLYVVDRHHLLYFGTGSYNSASNEYFDATIGRVTRYQTTTVGSNLEAIPASRFILLGETKETGIPMLHESHGVGSLAFAADGTLLVSAGDGASYFGEDDGSFGGTYWDQAMIDDIIRPEENVGAFRSQMLNSHNGKLLRLDPQTGNGVGSNPFFDPGNPRSAKSRVWAMGLRNPFRISVKPNTGSTNPTTGDLGEIYIGDVGWGLWEELNIIRAPGMNCGWPLFEGYGVLTEYAVLNKPNPDEPNPLFGTGGCTQQYFTFNDLIKQATADGNTTVYNPCNPADAIGSGNRFYHRRPSLDWRHFADVARVGIFNGSTPSTDTLGNPGSSVVGSSFRGNCSIGGTWYSGDAFPVEYKNTFFQADLGAEWVKRITVDFTDRVTRVDDFGYGFSNIVCIVQNPLDGTLVTVEMTDGVKRIAFGGNMPPVAKINSDKIFGPSALDVAFNGSSSNDPDGSISTYAWEFDDPGSGAANTSNLANPSHTFTVAGGAPAKFVVKLTVTDNEGATAVDSMIISVNNTAPEVNITSPVKNSFYTIGIDTLYTCSAAVTDTEHLPEQLTYEWQTFLRHNNHEHPEPIDTNKATTTRISRIGCTGDQYYWLVHLKVTDAAGLTTSDSSKIFPACQGALPLVLHNFSVTKQPGNANLIKWVTEMAVQIESFDVERSSDGINFYSIDRQAARNSVNTESYSFIDNNFPAGVVYYRLRMNEIGNVARYSVIIKISADSRKENILVAPNPVIGNFSVRYTAPGNGTALIRIIDMNGKLLHSLRESVNEGQNVIYIQNLPAWKSGTYIISVQQGNDIQYGKLIKAE